MNHHTFDDAGESRSLVELVLQDYRKGRLIDRLQLSNRPDKASIYELIDKLFSVLYYGFYPAPKHRADSAEASLCMTIEETTLLFRHLVINALPYAAAWQGKSDAQLSEAAADISHDFFSRIPALRDRLDTDLSALFDGDPAASCKDEILFAYPGFYAITVHRLAHELQSLGIPMLPRVMSERAHSLTGIDIHPGATIGDYFFIDHGTGIVVGETTVIGEHVKLYQGVTLGALSTRGGQALRGVRRHPTIGDRVTIYAGASVLGNTCIGSDCVIGSNVFITRDVPESTTVTLRDQELEYRQRAPRTGEAASPTPSVT